MNTIIERNVKIGTNVVIGAGSVVTKDCESNSVYAGVPAKRLMSINEFFEKRCVMQKSEAKELAKNIMIVFTNDRIQMFFMSTLCYLKQVRVFF